MSKAVKYLIVNKTTYLIERREEVKVLCDPRVKTAITSFGIRLCSFNNWTHLKDHAEHSVGA